MEELLVTTSPLALAVTSAASGGLEDLQQHLASFAAKVAVFRTAGVEAVVSTGPAETLDSAADPVIQSVVAILRAALRNGECKSLQVIKQSLTAAAWSNIQLCK